ncbi:MAG TPA: pitrilysin family protein, partial [Gemmatimonadaceae bacterium]|nr:pitrilysin family protein [Gemmatimonadaceae bacterium]
MHQRLLALGAIAILATLPRPLAAQRGGNPSTAPADRPLPDNPAVRSGRLPNGLTYYVLPNGYPAHRAELRLVVHAGSVLEDDDQRGLAHLLEHLAFDGSTHFPGHAVWDYLERAGMRVGADINAVTSYDETVYRLTIPTDSTPVLASGLQILADWAHGLTLDSAELERERKVVIEEWRLRRGASARIHDRQLPVLLAGSRYVGREPIGRVSTLERCTAAELRRFYHDWYRPDLMAVVIVGDVDADAVAARVRALFGGIPPASHALPRPIPKPPEHGAPRSSVVADPEATSTTVALVTERRHRAVRTEGDFRRAIAEGMYDDLLGARLDEAAHGEHAPFLSARASSGTPVRPMDVHELSARVDDRGVPRAIDALRAEAARVARGGFTAAELERERSAVLRRYDQLETQRAELPSSQLAATLIDEYLDGGRTPSLDTELTLARRIVPTIGLAELRRIAMERTTDSNLVVLVSGPASVPPVLPTPESVAAALARPPRALPPYVDSATAAPLLASPPAPGRVVYAMHFDSLGIDIWTLSNGVRVIL